MATTQDWAFGLSLYFIGLFVVVTLFSIAGAFSSGEVTTNTGYGTAYIAGDNFTSPADDISYNPRGGYLKDIFSFFVFNISFNEGNILIEYMWLLRIILVYLPLLALMYTVWYSLPTISS